MEKYEYVFNVSNKKVYDYNFKTFIDVTYKPKINSKIFKAIRDVFERGVYGEKDNIATYFEIKENVIDNKITVITNIDYNFTGINVYADIIPMRKKDYAQFRFTIIKEF